jgi:hypothetical protein
MKYLFSILLLLTVTISFAQTSDEAFKKPLRDVITQIENQYKVKIRYPEDLVKDKFVTYAGWRFRPDFDKTMVNIFSSLDITYAKEGEGKYKLQAYQYHLKTPQEGKEQLDYLASLYSNKEAWEARKAQLKSELLSALKLSPIPAKTNSKPIITNKRIYDGYSVENVALEVLPGVYTCGSLYSPLKPKGKIPVILNPDGHFGDGRYRADAQYRCAMEAKMGAMAFSYDLFAWGESLLQFKPEDHRRALAQTIQALNSIRILDWMLSLKNADPKRVAITGASGGGSQTMLITAIDDRIKLSVPVAMMSAYHSGGCPCESGMGVHLCGGGTNNVEIGSMAAPRPMLVISDGKDWTQQVPTVEFPFVKRTYAFYPNAVAENSHHPIEGHDYGVNKRAAMYGFIAKHFGLNSKSVQDKDGKFDESTVTIEKYPMMYVFGEKGEELPANAIKSFSELEKTVVAAKGE